MGKMDQMPIKKEIWDESVENRARRILETAYTKEEVNDILPNLKEGALEVLLEGIKSSPNPVQRRKYMSTWLEEWKERKQE